MEILEVKTVADLLKMIFMCRGHSLPDMDEVDFPFHNHKALPESNWAWNKEIVYPADQPEPPAPYDHYEDAVPKLWKSFV